MCMNDDLDAEMVDYYAARSEEYDDWYLRRGRYAHGEAADAAWVRELEQMRAWLSSVAMSGEIVDLAAGTGWWSPVLCGKGSVSLYDASPETLSFARIRLGDLGLEAGYEVRDAWGEPDRTVGGVFTGFWLSHVARERLAEFLALMRSWLDEGGIYSFIDSMRDPESGASNHWPPQDDVQVRRLDDGSTFRVRKVYYAPAELEAALGEAGFRDIEVGTTDRFFVYGRARR